MTIKEFVEKHRNPSPHCAFLGFVPRIICNDGFNFSVQASRTHYCSPRDDFGPWEAFEVGFPSKPSRLLTEYQEDRRKPQKDNVFGWVPEEVIDKIIKGHKGINVEETLRKDKELQEKNK